MFGEKIRGTINLNARTNELIAIRLEFCSKRIGKTGREYYHIDRYMTIPADDSGEIEFCRGNADKWQRFKHTLFGETDCKRFIEIYFNIKL